MHPSQKHPSQQRSTSVDLFGRVSYNHQPTATHPSQVANRSSASTIVVHPLHAPTSGHPHVSASHPSTAENHHVHNVHAPHHEHTTPSHIPVSSNPGKVVSSNTHANTAGKGPAAAAGFKATDSSGLTHFSSSTSAPSAATTEGKTTSARPNGWW